MFGSKELGFALACLILCGGGAACDAGVKAENAAHPGNQAGAEAGAEFRHVAPRVYHAAASRSCGGGSVDYAQVLADEIAALRRFEASTDTPNVQFQLSIARSDIERSGGACWEDGGDPRFAESHIRFARGYLTHGLATLPGLATDLPVDAPDDPLPPSVGAEFRARVEPLVQAVNPRCQLSGNGDDDAIIAPARLALDAFERRLQGSPYALHFDIAEADVLYLQSVTVVECATPHATSPAVMTTEATQKMNSEIVSIEARFDLR